MPLLIAKGGGIGGGGGGAPTNAQYIVVALNATLTNERRLQGTANQIILVDGGANGDLTLSTPQDIHTGAIPEFAGLGLNQAVPGAMLQIDTSGAAIIGAIVKGSAAQSAHMLELQDSGGSAMTLFTEDGHLGIGTDVAFAEQTIRVNKTIGSSITSGTRAFNHFVIIYNGAAGVPLSPTLRAFQTQITVSPSGTAFTGTAESFTANLTCTGTKTIVSTKGLRLGFTSTATGTVQNWTGLEFNASFAANTPMITYTNIRIQAPTGAGAPTMTTQYGLHIEDQVIGTFAYAIYTNAGDIVFNAGLGQCDFLLNGDNYALIQTDSSDDELFLGGNAAALIGFYGAAAVNQREKANYNNWAAFGDVVDALVDLGLFDVA